MYGLMPRRRQVNLFDAMDAFMRMPSIDMSEDKFFRIKTDVREEGESYILEAELPGFEKQDINLDISNDVLTISAQSVSEESKENEGYVSRERRQGSFKRSFSLEGINQNDIIANYQNGILKLVLPKEKKEQPEVKKIEIQ